MSYLSERVYMRQQLVICKRSSVLQRQVGQLLSKSKSNWPINNFKTASVSYPKSGLFNQTAFLACFKLALQSL
jgi:hypothetical protein